LWFEDFVFRALPCLTAVVLALGLIARFWRIRKLGWGKEEQEERGDPIKGALSAVTLELLPWVELPAKRGPLHYSIGLLMHISIIALLVIYYTPLASLLGLEQLATQASTYLSALALITSVILLARRVHGLMTKNAVGMLTDKQDVFDLALVVLLAASWLNTSLAFSTFSFAINALILQIILIYTPFSKFIHPAMFFAMRLYTGYQRGMRGEVR